MNITNFSFSAISTFKSCPRAFEYKYVKKLPEAFSSVEAHMGTSVHKALEWAYVQRQEGHEPTSDMALEQYKQAWNSGDFQNIKVIKEDKSSADYFHQGREFIASFFQRIFPRDNSTTLYLEHKFQIPLGDEVVYRGVIDRIAKGPDGTIRVTDFKTGKVAHPLDTLQLPSYALYIFRHNIDNQIELCLEDLREQRTMVVPFTRQEIKKVRTELLGEIDCIMNTGPEDFIASPSILCLWCGYNTICDNPHESVKIKRAGAGITGDLSTKGEFREACPLCGGQLRERQGKFGPFLGCANFPQCRYTRDLGMSKDNPAADPQIEGKEICPECGSLLKQRKGKYGAFMGCSNYPHCRFTRPVT